MYAMSRPHAPTVPTGLTVATVRSIFLRTASAMLRFAQRKAILLIVGVLRSGLQTESVTRAAMGRTMPVPLMKTWRTAAAPIAG